MKHASKNLHRNHKIRERLQNAVLQSKRQRRKTTAQENKSQQERHERRTKFRNKSRKEETDRKSTLRKVPEKESQKKPDKQRNNNMNE